MPDQLPKGLTNGAYIGFISDTNSTASHRAQLWIEMCQAVLYVLGTNCTMRRRLTVERAHPVSQSIVKALRLEQPTEPSDAEQFILKTPAAKESRRTIGSRVPSTKCRVPLNRDVESKSSSTPIYNAKEDVHGCDF